LTSKPDAFRPPPTSIRTVDTFIEERNDAERDNYKMECGPEKIESPGMQERKALGAK
jgi:hypothetical protein